MQVAWSRILLGVAAGAVLLLVSVNLAVLSVQLVRLHREENRLLTERGQLESQSMKLGGEASQLKKRQAEREEQVRFLQEDLPVLEVLATLDALTPQGMSLESLKIQGKGLTLRGIAPGQDQVVALTTALNEQPLFASVGLPQTETRLQGNEPRIAFSLECTLRGWPEYLQKLRREEP